MREMKEKLEKCLRLYKQLKNSLINHKKMVKNKERTIVKYIYFFDKSNF